MTLTVFLLARIVEDETTAKAAAGGRWWRSQVDDADLDDAHIARHDPARVLAECEAKRCIVGIATRPEHQSFLSPMVDVLMALALPYADHPDYRSEWHP